MSYSRSKKPSALFPRIRQLHAWSGLLISVVLALLSVSGTLLIFKEDYLGVALPQAHGVVDLSPIGIGSAIESLEREFGADELSYVLLAHADHALHRVVMRSGEAAYALTSGDVVERWQENERPEDWLFDLHHYLLLGERGEIVAGFVALAAIVMAGSGIYLFLPFRKRFSLQAWPVSTHRRDILAYHRNAGVLFFLPIVVLLITGAGMVFYSQASSVLSALTLSTPAPFVPPTGQAGDIDWRKAMLKAQAVFPDAEPRLLIWPRRPDAAALIRLRQNGEWHQNGRSLVYIDPATSEVLKTRDATLLSRGERATNAIYPIHSAGVGGRVYDVVAATTGLSLAALSLFAAWTYIKRLKRRGGQG
ncbi:MAG: PepSY-associated TM helix domain-containing protein [Pseudomonadota bacterium]